MSAFFSASENANGGKSLPITRPFISNSTPSTPMERDARNSLTARLFLSKLIRFMAMRQPGATHPLHDYISCCITVSLLFRLNDENRFEALNSFAGVFQNGFDDAANRTADVVHIDHCSSHFEFGVGYLNGRFFLFYIRCVLVHAQLGRTKLFLRSRLLLEKPRLSVIAGLGFFPGFLRNAKVCFGGSKLFLFNGNLAPSQSIIHTRQHLVGRDSIANFQTAKLLRLVSNGPTCHLISWNLLSFFQFSAYQSQDSLSMRGNFDIGSFLLKLGDLLFGPFQVFFQP